MVLTVLLTLALAVSAPDDALQRLTQMRREVDVSSERVRATLEEGLAQLNDAATRNDQCLREYYSGELYRLAAALDPDNDYADEAMARFREMRIEFLDLGAGPLGYLGEARVLRQQGKPAEAIAALKPLLDNKANPRLQRAAELEAMEAILQTDPVNAAEQARSFGEGAEWVLARAYAATDRREEALSLVRDEAALSGVSVYDRLELIAGLDALTDEERLEWAGLLAALGRSEEALDALDHGQSLPPSALHAALLTQADRHADAVEQWRRVMHEDADPQAMFAMAQSLEAISRPDEAVAAYRQVVESDAPAELRRGALSSLANLLGPRDSLAVLQAHRELVGSDPYLRYLLASSKWANGITEGLTDEADEIARDADSDELRAAARLLQAQAQPDARAAMQVLDAHSALLEATPAIAAQVYALRVRNWVELGRIDSAADAMLAEPQRYPPRELLTVADALTARYEESPDPALRERVLRLCDGAIGRSGNDVDPAAGAVELMLRIGAYNDALRVAKAMDTPDGALLTARALLKLDQPAEALAQLENLTTAQATLIRGQCELAMGQPQRAVDAFRDARRDAVVDSENWWQATFALCRAQLALDQRDAAAAVLRVAEAMHPLDDRPKLRQQFESLQSELQP